MRIDVHHHWHDSDVASLKEQFTKLEKRMSKEMDDLQREVQEMGTVVDSAVTLIKGLAQQIRDAGTDKTKLLAMANELDAKAAELGGAVSANTPAEGPGTVNPIP